MSGLELIASRGVHQNDLQPGPRERYQFYPSNLSTSPNNPRNLMVTRDGVVKIIGECGRPKSGRVASHPSA